MTTPAGMMLRADGQRCYWIGKVAFVPAEPHRYLRTVTAVLKAPCSHCGAEIGHPCVGTRSLITDTHHVRRKAARRTP